MVIKKKSRQSNRQRRSKQVIDPTEEQSSQVVTPTNSEPELLTREEHRLTRHGRYELDPQTRKLTQNGKTTRLKHRLNLFIFGLVMLIVLTYLVLFFL